MTPTGIAERSQRSEAARAARREEIIDAARRVFAERGFSGTTIADIADEAQIALGTVYLYFKSKDELFAALNQRLAELITAAASGEIVARSLEAAVRRRVERIFDACSRNRDLVRVVVLNTDPGTAATRRIAAAEANRERPLVRMLEQALEAGLIRSGDPVIMTRLIFGLVSIAVYQAFVLSDGSDAEKYRDAAADMLVAYLTPPAA